MQDGRYSRLIQAAGLMAYVAFPRRKQDHPEIWGIRTHIATTGIMAYMKAAACSPVGSDHGDIWLDG